MMLSYMPDLAVLLICKDANPHQTQTLKRNIVRNLLVGKCKFNILTVTMMRTPKTVVSRRPNIEM